VSCGLLPVPGAVDQRDGDGANDGGGHQPRRHGDPPPPAGWAAPVPARWCLDRLGRRLGEALGVEYPGLAEHGAPVRNRFRLRPGRQRQSVRPQGIGRAGGGAKAVCRCGGQRFAGRMAEQPRRMQF
jgi:hypothetical protein